MKKVVRTLTPRIAVALAASVATLAAGLSTAGPAGASTSSTNLMNVESRLCMGVSGNNFFNGAPIIMWDCGFNHADQYWNGIPPYQLNDLHPDKGYVMIQNAEHSNYCLAAPFNGEPYSQQLIIEPCNQQDAHQWWDVYYVGNRNGAAILTNEATSRVAQAHEPNQDGAPVIQEPEFAGATNQQWYA